MAEPVDKDPNYWVLCIDDDPFLRLGLQNALDQTKDIELSAASTKAEGTAPAKRKVENRVWCS